MQFVWCYVCCNSFYLSICPVTHSVRFGYRYLGDSETDRCEICMMVHIGPGHSLFWGQKKCVFDVASVTCSLAMSTHAWPCHLWVDMVYWAARHEPDWHWLQTDRRTNECTDRFIYHVSCFAVALAGQDSNLNKYSKLIIVKVYMLRGNGLGTDWNVWVAWS